MDRARGNGRVGDLEAVGDGRFIPGASNPMSLTVASASSRIAISTPYVAKRHTVAYTDCKQVYAYLSECSMSGLADKKTEEEIAMLKTQRKAAHISMYLELSKAVALLLGAIVVFWFIQQPESILNRASSKETIARERAKLMLDWLKGNDPERQADAVAVIRAAYGESDDAWIRQLELRLRIKAQAIAVNNLLEQYSKLLEKSNILKKKMDMEEMGVLGTRPPGQGPIWYAIRQELASTEFEMGKILEQLKSYGFDVSNVKQ